MKTTKTTNTATGNDNGNGSDNDNANTDTNGDDNDNDSNNFEFVVVLGLEGTGHHLYNALIDQSPYFKLYQNLITSNSQSQSTTSTSTSSKSSNFPQSLLNELRHSLFDTKSNIGLINAPCTERRVPIQKSKAKNKKAKNNKAKKSNSSSKRTRQQSSSSSSRATTTTSSSSTAGGRKLNVEHESEESYDPNSQEIFNRVVTALNDIKQLVIENNDNENNTDDQDDDDELKKLKSKIKLRIPINGGFGNTPRYGMLSYPNWKDLQQKQNSQDQQSQSQKLQSCRSYQHLSLDLLYHACHNANVICKHLYIYRNPIDILISTVYKRNFHGSHGYLFASRLYITMLQILESQLTNNVENSLGCIDFYEDENGNADNDYDNNEDNNSNLNEGIENDWKTLIRDVWGWSSSTNNVNDDYEHIIENTYKKKQSISSSLLLFKNNSANSNTTNTTTTDSSSMINELNTFIQNNKPYLDLFYTAHQRTIHAGCHGHSH
ncbi:hypothetical protein FRACYDRAFT_252603 [Fragilariopsis cylindrus CCMP1102]|uniref:Uncharacterized protein n=1 Tax=Fragilariopsis cylindrus CCMP1102 TaxID=635003 RepID=A0A1E7EM50_9STRA|nr:hypothetical protein FRACYDRAFT_252603 [Fragilariopsis cylindrus CCMP1102]|eukprot:OEU06971.1 hypothetical protein FRACYDRAFT_252603 [Fragilariopsis cylindrus CCMP1102]